MGCGVQSCELDLTVPTLCNLFIQFILLSIKYIIEWLHQETHHYSTVQRVSIAPTNATHIVSLVI